jgi:hypothetical protein
LCVNTVAYRKSTKVVYVLPCTIHIRFPHGVRASMRHSIIEANSTWYCGTRDIIINVYVPLL